MYKTKNVKNTRDRQILEEYRWKRTLKNEYITNQSPSLNNWNFDEEDVYEGQYSWY